MLAKLAKRREAQDRRLQLTDEARELLADVGFDPVLGARPLRRAIQGQAGGSGGSRPRAGRAGWPAA
ncbi:hypothetical protein G6F31_018688 [Rhizopus arrhizus]|nr:hypothetical protein G6F31_018688 [Rhizopus arrhizus]